MEAVRSGGDLSNLLAGATKHSGKFTCPDGVQRFDAYYFQNGYTGIRITKEMTDCFIYCPDDRLSGWYVKERLLRDFAVFLKDQRFSEIYIPIVQSAPPRSSFTPYIFTDDEIRRLFEAIDSWEDSPFTNRILIDPIFFRLLYSTGMRLSEALNLTLKDFDNGVFTVYHAKNNKDCIVQLHPNMAERTKTYIENVHRFSKETDYLFPSPRGYNCCIDQSTMQPRAIWSTVSAVLHHLGYLCHCKNIMLTFFVMEKAK